MRNNADSYRVLHVMAGAQAGGAETAFVDMCVAMREAGVQVEAVLRKHESRQRRLREANVKAHVLPFGGKLDLYTPYRLRGIIREFRPDIVQCWMSRAGQKTPRWTRASGCPPYQVVARLGNNYKLSNFPAADHYVALTPAIGDYVRGQGVAPDHVREIPNFAETEIVTAPVDRASLDTPADAPLLVALGRLHRAKAFDILLDALALLPGVYLWIAGDGPDRAALEAQAAQLGIEKRVRFLGWRDDRAALLQAADLCVFPSRYEPFGSVFIQAWAQKIPLVTTASDGPRQFVRDGEDARMVDIDDAPALAGAVRELLNDPDLAARLVEAGYRRYLSEFTKESCVNAYLDFYGTIRADENAGLAAS